VSALNLIQSDLRAFKSTLFSPLFVTWDTLYGQEWRLRGCIGNFEAMPVHEGIAEYALISAFRDSRFKKVEKNELEKLRCG
jgi:AMME syndrome candidate gene 1 protein